MPKSFAPPPLPPSWPYAPRGPLPELRERSGQELPGLAGAWTLWAPGGWAPPADAEPQALAFGRGGIRRCGPLVLRPYRRGGLLRHLNGRLYLSPERFRAELAVHRALWEAGFPTVQPLGCAWRRRLWGFEGVYLSLHTPAQPWPRIWGDQEDLPPQLPRLLGALCAWGLWAPDLNATNLLVEGNGQWLALDWDRAGWGAGGDLAEGYRERLRRSLAKLGASQGLRRALEDLVIP